jgi:FAD dependent monooxygenase
MGDTTPSSSPPRSGPRVLIAGGSITGLSLALMLDNAEIDFTLLEARESVTPQVGAGVAINPNGFRILDQLGTYDDFMTVGKTPLEYAKNWWPDGTLHSRDDGVSDLFTKTLGYPLLVLDRQQALGILYEHNRRKDCIFAGKKWLYNQARGTACVIQAHCGS